jgi:hypothetical protein
MENLKNYFNFSGTISGTTFILRWLISYVIQFFGGYMVGMGILNNGGILMVGFMFAAIGIALQLSTFKKRSRALFPNDRYSLFFTSYLIISILLSAFKDVDPTLGGFLGIVILVLFGITIFKNSGLSEDSHEG